MASIETVASSDVILSAIPNQALISLSPQHLKGFSGVIAAMGIDAPVRWVRDALPHALVVRTSPAISQGSAEIRAIGLLDAELTGDPRLPRAKSALQTLGPVAWIEEEVLYDLTTLLAGPLLTLIKSAVSRTVEDSLETNHLPLKYKDELETVVLGELAKRSGASWEASGRAENERSTPGGVTEIALRHRDGLSCQLDLIVTRMLSHMSQLRNERNCRMLDTL
ncbi:hypothetical protein RFM26_28920 [Mesorhizobium sp. VK23B]|uniref:Uncharacterized protein n=1 Tax=Mesorhizobium dulcispinae TaxID=3072316 RepID=A0ABU4XMU8_9HYPH|nr:MULTISPECIES: hypothetical protein [unclassified Mesorhizobium]MDX8469720.1 hypothetical protein [Mesorhizobium sp. VK23B]MDX8476059.1 hypothetical protein [Mesorhizobium sp. VK23A]